MQKQNQNKTQRWIAVIAIIIALSMISLFSALFIGFFISSEDTKETGNIALISIKGIILPDSAGSMFQSNVADSTTITELIEQANKNKKNKSNNSRNKLPWRHSCCNL